MGEQAEISYCSKFPLPPPCQFDDFSVKDAKRQNKESIMRLSRYFLPVLKENPSEAQIVSHRLMLRAGMIKQASAGIYSWLPLGFKVMRKIEDIVHEEQI